MNLFNSIKEEKDIEKPIISIADKINDHFNIPIFYNKNKVELKENISTDLELVQPIDPSSNSIYSFYFNTHNNVSKKVNDQIVKYYTTDTIFLEDNQKLLKKYVPLPKNDIKNSDKYKNIINIWNEIKLDQGFREKYYYVDWEILEFLNRSEIFLQFISIYNLFSPIFSLMMPILILIVPFFIIRMRGLNLTISEYCDVLKIVAQTNAVGKIFTTNFNEINIQEKFYILISAGFYLFSIYQNIMVCVRFNNNMKKIHEYFVNIEDYVNNTIENMENYLLFSKDITSHNEFNEIVVKKLFTLKNIAKKISNISEYNIYNFSKFKEIGNIFKYFYELHTDITYDDAIMYSLGFNGYIDCFEGLQENIKERKISFAKFTKDKKKSNIFKKSYYACLSNKKPVKNTIKLKKNIIITGPNASGKTTILKSTLINIILSQQFGCGFYDSAQLTPFNHIHCYLNIPDTSGRDSLFQAEARRCKEILDCISENPKDSHFCVFDELYSGTNPEEAEISATSFMIYLQKYKLVSSLLTTHFIKVCKNLEKTKTIQNYKMLTQLSANKKLIYTYKMEPGISEVKGGINVLTDLNYPKEIIDRTILESS
jgi:energy-coupling factor transporter ATP-binding protein EcfA2